MGAPPAAPPVETGPPTRPRLLRLFTAVVLVQGVHVVEHVIQLLQVYVFHVPSERSFGLLGHVLNLMGTAEWMHFAFNLAYLGSLYVLFVKTYELVVNGTVSRRTFAAFAVFGAGLETWHMTEHVVIIANVLRNNGCPCPGIGDRVLNVSDIQLHFVYNAVTYGTTLMLFTASRRAMAWRWRAVAP